MITSKPFTPTTFVSQNEILVMSGKPVNVESAKSGFVKSMKPSEVKSRTERSAPVRNPAFREHEGLKALQRELNTRRPARQSK
jgi:hypothetical protein